MVRYSGTALSAEDSVAVAFALESDASRFNAAMEDVHQGFGYYFHVSGLAYSIDVWLEPDIDIKMIDRV